MSSIIQCVEQSSMKPHRKEEVLQKLESNRDGHLKDKIVPDQAKIMAVQDALSEIKSTRESIYKQVNDQVIVPKGDTNTVDIKGEQTALS